MQLLITTISRSLVLSPGYLSALEIVILKNTVSNNSDVWIVLRTTSLGMSIGVVG